MDESVFDALDRLQDTMTSIHPLNTNHEPAVTRDNQSFELLQRISRPGLSDDRAFRRSNLKSWQDQAAPGRAQSSLPSVQPGQLCRGRQDTSFDDDAAYHQHLEPIRAHQAFSSAVDNSTSDVFPSSSPAYQASQRRIPSDKSGWVTRTMNPLESVPLQQLALSTSFASSRQTSVRPVVQGTELVPVQDLSDRFRTLFSFPFFNAMQSRCFPSIYETSDNFVLSSPTGSGKTVIFDLAICRLLNGWQSGTFKVVYMAPTKALCAERKGDWKKRFAALGLQCEELTGDSDVASLHNVQSADIIVTTPEKWDSMTRKWKDHEKLVGLIKLFLIDEVHILSKDRGAALEAVVSRMKSVGSDIRFVALSATVPNSHDIAVWLGRDPGTPKIPAICKRFGEEFRPVRLQKHVCGYQSNSNAFAFDSTLNKKLPDVISRYSQRKPIMIFCFTRKSCADAAKYLSEWWSASPPTKRYWPGPRCSIRVGNRDLCNTITAGVAIHHGGLSSDDRLAVEKAYLEGDVHVICCTSTLSVGVNLPCHMVIIKNTCMYEGNAIKEYSDLDIMQMIGRAGRPQFDDSAIAVIMTKLPQVAHYEQMVSGQEQLESCLHLNLVEHMNSEIGLGTITDLHSAKRWLQGTFLRVRLQENPRYYRIEGDTSSGNLEQRLGKICTTAVSQLTEHELVVDEPRLKLTEYGEAMARYYVNINTMIAILSILEKPKLSEILSMLAQAHEFREIRLRSGEKQLYKELNNAPGIRFPIKVDIALPAHKVTLIIQSVLGGVDSTINDSVHRLQYTVDQGIVFQHVNRLIRCIIDCQAYRKDAIGIRNALLLSRSFAAKVWDDSPLVLRQIDQVGPVAVRKLVAANINDIEDLEHSGSSRIENILSKNPALAHKIISNAKAFPKLRIGVNTRSQHVVKHGEHVAINLTVELGFLNEKVPTQYQRKPVFVIMLAETSDGHMVHFCRISARKMADAAPILFAVHLKHPTRSIICYAMCDELAGTLKQVRLDLDIPAAAFQSIKEVPSRAANANLSAGTRVESVSQISKSQGGKYQCRISNSRVDDWDDGGIDDDEFLDAAEGDLGFVDIDDLAIREESDGRHGPQSVKQKKVEKQSSDQQEDAHEPRILKNGKWACSHNCKDKSACRHMCCREGLDKKPKPKKPKTVTSGPKKTSTSSSSGTQSKLDLLPRKQRLISSKKDDLEHLDLSLDNSAGKTNSGARLYGDENPPRLNVSTKGSKRIPSLVSNRPEHSYLEKYESQQDLLGHVDKDSNDSFTDGGFDDLLMDDLPDPSTFIRSINSQNQSPEDAAYMDADPEMLDALLVGAEDSHQLKIMGSEYEEHPILQVNSGMNVKDNARHSSNQVPVFSSDSALFVSQGPREPSGSEKRFTALTPSKRKAGEMGPQSSAKRFEKDVPSASCSSHDTEMLDVAVHKDAEMAELRAWLAAELGDSVELVEFMEDGN